MKKQTVKFNFETSRKLAAVFLLAISVAAFGCNFSVGNVKPDMPNDAAIQTLVKNTVSDFADAIDKGDFKSFREKGSKELQSQFSDDQMKTGFKGFLDAKDDVVPILRDAAKQNAQFSPAPAMNEESGYYVLQTKGKLPASQQEVNFDNKYVYQDGAWKLLKVGVNLE